MDTGTTTRGAAAFCTTGAAGAVGLAEVAAAAVARPRSEDTFRPALRKTSSAALAPPVRRGAFPPAGDDSCDAADGSVRASAALAGTSGEDVEAKSLKPGVEEASFADRLLRRVCVDASLAAESFTLVVAATSLANVWSRLVFTTGSCFAESTGASSHGANARGVAGALTLAEVGTACAPPDTGSELAAATTPIAAFASATPTVLASDDRAAVTGTAGVAAAEVGNARNAATVGAPERLAPAASPGPPTTP